MDSWETSTGTSTSAGLDPQWCSCTSPSPGPAPWHPHHSPVPRGEMHNYHPPDSKSWPHPAFLWGNNDARHLISSAKLQLHLTKMGLDQPFPTAVGSFPMGRAHKPQWKPGMLDRTQIFLGKARIKLLLPQLAVAEPDNEQDIILFSKSRAYSHVPRQVPARFLSLGDFGVHRPN